MGQYLQAAATSDGVQPGGETQLHPIESALEPDPEETGGMTLPFTPMLMTFTDICYFVDLPAVSSDLKACLEYNDC